MSSTIDERVVEMRFDNKQFESNVATSMGTLDKLKKSLQLDGAAKGFENISSSAKNINFNPLSSGIETVRSRFSALEVMAVTALANITNSAVNAGKNLISAFTIDPIKTGFEEFELKMGSVQTIMAGTGESLETVNKYLAELNEYSDKTIYSFSDMTTNIGKFTNAGVSLDKAVLAIKGISNEAAVSGANANEASRAMYNFSQALSAGYVKLIDWKSIENANMATVEFKQQLIDTAVACGTLTDNLDGTYTTLDKGTIISATQNFNDSLQEQWMTTDVLVETLGRYADETTEIGKKAYASAQDVKTFSMMMDTLKEAAQSGWAETWEIIIGDFEEGKKLWTGLADYFGNIIGKSASARNKVLSDWKELGGRTALIYTLQRAFSGLMNIVNAAKHAFREVFPRTTGKTLLHLTFKVKELAVAFDNFTKGQYKNIKAAFKGIFSAIEIGVIFVKRLASGILTLVQNITGVPGKFLDLAAAFGNWLSSLRDSIKETDIFGTAINKIVGIVQKGIDKIKELWNAFKPSGSMDFSFLDGIKNVFKAIFELAKKIGSAFSTLFSGDISVNMSTFMNLLMTFFSGKLVSSIVASIKSIGDFTGVLDTIADAFEMFQSKLKAKVLQKIAIAIAILAVSLLVLSTINPDKLAPALLALTGLIGDIMGSMALLDKVGSGSKGLVRLAAAMIRISIAVLILAYALKKIGDMELANLGKGLLGVTAILGIVTGAAIALSKFASTSSKIFSISKNGIFSKKTKTNIIALGFAMIEIAVAIKILASACEDFAALSWEELAKGISAIGAILLEFVGFAALIKLIKPEKMISSALSLILIGAAMEIFANVAKKFGEMEWGELGKAGAAIGSILILAAGFGYLSNYSGQLMKASISLILIGAAMEIMVDVSKKFGAMEWGELGKAGAAITGLLVLAAGFGYLSNYSGQLIKSSVSLILIGAAMEIMVDVCQKFGAMEWGELGKAGAAITGILVLAAGFGIVAGLAPSIITASASLLIMAVALSVLAPAMKTLGEMSWGEVATSLVVLAGAFAIIGVAGLLLAPLIPVLLGLGAAILLLGVGCAATGAGIMLLSAGLSALAVSGSAGIGALVLAIEALISLIPYAFAQIGEGIVALIQSIADSSVALVDAVVEIASACITALETLVPQIVEFVLSMTETLLQSLTEHAPAIVNSLINFVISLFDTLASRASELTGSLVNFLSAAISALGEHIPELVAAGFELVSSIIQSIVDALGPFIQEVIVPLLDTLGIAIGSIATALAPIVDSISQAIQSICDAFVVLIEQISPIIDSVTQLVQQFGDSISQVFESVSGTISVCGDTISQILSSIADTISQVFETVGDTISTCGDTISQILTTIADTISTTFSGISDVITSIGDSIKSVLDGVAGVISSIGEAALNAGSGFEKLANGVKTITQLNIVDMAASLAAVAAGISDIASHSGGLADAGSGMQQLADGTNLTAAAFDDISAGVSSLITNITSVSTAALLAMTSLQLLVTSSATSFSAITTGMSTTLLTATSAAMQFTIVGLTIVSSISNGIINHISYIRSAITSVMANVSASLHSSVATFYNIGGYAADGFARGIRSKISAAVQAAVDMANAAADAAKTALDINSPSRVFQKLAGYVPQGFAKGIYKNLGIVTNSATDMAKAVKDTFKDEMGIHSPSTEMYQNGQYSVYGLVYGLTDEKPLVDKATEKLTDAALSAFGTPIDDGTYKDLGKYSVYELTYGLTNGAPLIDKATGQIIGKLSEGGETAGGAFGSGVASGIANNTEPEQSAEEKAKAIVEAFKEQLESASRDLTTYDQEYNLWEAVNPEATDIQKNEVQIELAMKKIAKQTEIVTIAQEKYNQTFAALGPDAEETQERYNEWVSAMTELIGYQNTYNKLAKESSSISQTAYESYLKYLKEGRKLQDEFGFSDEEIINWAKQQSGYGIKTAKSISETCVEVLGTTLEPITSAFSDMGSNLVTNFASGLTSTSTMQTISDTIDTVAENSLTSIESSYDDWNNAGATIVDNFVSGIKDNMVKIQDVAIEMADTIIDTIVDKLQAIPSIISSAFAGLSDTSIQISGGLGDLSTISPVVDMRNVSTDGLTLTSKLTTSFNGPVDKMAQALSNTQASIEASNHEVVTAVNALRSDIADLYSNSDQEIGLYIDSKKLASSIARPMNYQLNILSKRGAY